MLEIGIVRFFFALPMVVTVAACSGSGGGGGGGGGGTSDGGGGTGDGGSAPAKAAFGADCKHGDDCETGVCLTGDWGGFCTRQCTKASDCPEMGWECNISPYTACVPKH